MQDPRPTVRLKLLTAPVLPSEGWTSIDLYRADLDRAFDAIGAECDRTTVLPNEAAAAPWFRRQADLYLWYPLALRAAQAAQGGAPVVHILDHSYAHLCRITRHGVVTCHDLAPLRIRELPAHREAIFRWRTSGLSHAKAVVCVSRHTASDVRALTRVADRRIIVNPLGIDAAFTRLPPGQARARFADILPPRVLEGFKLLHVGSLLERKNLPVLLHALARLRATLPDAVLLKVGAPLRGSVYAGLIDRLDLRDAVIDLGPTDHATLIDLYNLADLFVFPSLYEGFGRPVLEAQACGTPTVLARTSSLPEVGGDGALYFDATDEAALAALLGRLAAAPDERRRLGAAGIENARRFTWQSHAARLIEIYRAVDAGDL